jgi:hypothetical protein
MQALQNLQSPLKRFQRKFAADMCGNVMHDSVNVRQALCSSHDFIPKVLRPVFNFAPRGEM